MTRSEESSTDAQYPSQPLGTTDPRDLALPLYGATFGQAASRYLRSYARFSGRASRSEFWWGALAYTLALILCGVLVAAAGDNSTVRGLALVVVGVVVLGSVIPNWALLVRRLHDANLSGWMSLLTFFPYVGLVFGLLPSKPLGARFDRRKTTSDPMPTDSAPGWDAIDAAFARLYPGLDGVAPHFGRTDARLPGQGIWGITAYPNTAAPQPH